MSDLLKNRRIVDLNSIPKTSGKMERGYQKWQVQDLAVGEAFDIEQIEGKPKYSTIKVYTYDWRKASEDGRKFFRVIDNNNGWLTVVRMPDKD